MQYLFAGTDFSFEIPLDPPADAASIKWSLRDNGGALMSSFTSLSVANSALASSVLLPTTIAANTKTLASEARYIVVTWASGGATQTTTYAYVLIDWAPIQAQPNDVRVVTGMNEAELLDSDIDLVTAAVLTRADIGGTIFDAALTSGDASTVRINRLIAIRSAIELAPSLGLRIAKDMASDTSKFSRFADADFDAMTATWREYYDKLKLELTPLIPIEQPTIFTTSYTRTDPILNMYPDPTHPIVISWPNG